MPHSSCPVHLVLTSWGAPGHIFPIAQLANYLVSNRSWKPETFVSLAVVLNDNTAGKVSLPIHPNIRLISCTEVSNRQWTGDMFKCSEQIAESFTPKLVESHKDWPAASAVIYDIVTPIGPMLCKSMNIPGFTFMPSPLYFMRLMFEAHLKSGPSKLQVPGIGEFTMERPDLSDESNPMNRWFQSMVKAGEIALLSSRAVIANDVQSFYSEAFLNDLKNFVGLPNGLNVLCCGPLALMDPRTRLRGAEASSEVMNFMASFGPRSVLFICLGTSWAPSNQDLVELVRGIAMSNKPFVFAYRGQDRSADPYPEFAPPNPPANEPTEADGIPIGFRNEVKGRGLIVRWVNQPLVLQHGSLGAFMTHCGWNSILENMSFGGVPFLLLPIGGDQQYNAEFLEQHLKVGLRIRPSDGGLTRDEVCDKVNALFANDELSNRAVELKQLIAQETSENGVSEINTRNLFDMIC
eukprot:Gregarina_sp_Pseudo_9__2314@NODE_262_length_3360_cov_153_092743_g245_i0_p1_GENE_NODE_262_length_3360_cov_153_092743_g245_i0NODE_262_length_3360_cov_153_092743_g245_i0_p1_ORF_typecomplete_len464_score48_26UDPGT/PF00201_18/1_5e36Glyco_tran_28_C/PF04101_16/0_00057Glyco_transf_28/PF03033_20/0_19_NODE_262_length_3360_cov_153_092743_g245_i018883279